MGRLVLVMMVALVAIPLAQGQTIDPSIIGDTLRPAEETALDTAVPHAENATGDDLQNEEIHIRADIQVSNIEYQVVPILFGGGKIQADLRGDLSLDFHAVSAIRLDQALQAAAGNDNVSLNASLGVPTDRLALTAEEIRLLGAGVLLSAFQEQQEALAAQYVSDLLPGLRLLALEVEWSNTQPLTEVTEAVADPTQYSPAIPSLRDPPLRLAVTVDLQYLDRVSLFDIVEKELSKEPPTDAEDAKKDANKALKKRIRENQTVPFLERNAFQVLGFSQLLNLAVQPGWSLDVEFTVPKGFTIEGVTDELDRSPTKATATYFLDGSDGARPDADAGIITLSNRFLVTTVLFAAVLVAGGVIRALVEGGAMAFYRKRSES